MVHAKLFFKLKCYDLSVCPLIFTVIEGMEAAPDCGVYRRGLWQEIMISYSDPDSISMTECRQL